MLTQPYRAVRSSAMPYSLCNPEFNNPDDVWQFVRLWDFADCVLKGGVSANVTEAVTEGDSGLQKASKWISKLKTLIPKQSNKEAVGAVSLAHQRCPKLVQSRGACESVWGEHRRRSSEV